MNDVRWDEVPTLFGAGPERPRVRRSGTDEHGKAYVAVRRRRRAARACRPARTTCARATGRASARPATSRPARSRSSSTGRSASRASSNPVPASGGVDPEPEDAARDVDPARRAHARPRRLAARLRGLRPRVRRRRRRRTRRSSRCGPAGRSSSRSRFEGGDRLERPRRRSCGYGDPRVAGGRPRRDLGDVPARAEGRRRPGLRERRGPGQRRVRAADCVLLRRARPGRAGLPLGDRGGRPHGRGRARRRRRPALHGHDRRASPTACSPSSPPSAPADGDPGRAAGARPSSRSTRWRR